MVALTLPVQRREVTGKKNRKLRTQGKIPAVLYGHGIKPAPITLDYAAFEKIYDQAGESTLIDVVVDNQEPVKALIQDVQRDAVGNEFIHVDLHQIRMDEELHAAVELKFIGEAPAVKEIGAVLVTPMDSLDIKCLPKDLVHEIEVDLSSLKEFDDMIHVSDINIPAGITLEVKPDEVVAMVQEPRSEKELETAVPEGEAVEGEAVPEGEAVEGEAAEAEGASEEKSEK